MNVNRAPAKSHRELIAAIGEAAKVLRRAPPLSDESVHRARKAIKKARAALRLLRAGLGESTYKAQNVALRNAGRCLAPIRDAKVLSEAFNALRERHRDEFGSMNSLAKQLSAQRVSTQRKLFDSTSRLRNCYGSLASSHARAKKWKATELHPSIVAAGVKRIHRAGRKALAGAQRDSTPEALHEWRKQVKYLSNALKVLDVSDDRDLVKIEKRAEKLADRLGEDHDLAELARYFRAVGIGKEVTGRIERRRVKLRKLAYGLGAKIYTEKPNRFASRFAGSGTHE